MTREEAIKRTKVSYRAMKTRCLNTNRKNYPRYGGRGITICQRWLDGFEMFVADMGLRPEGKTIDRIDSNGNYEPNNCRWATRKQQDRDVSFQVWLRGPRSGKYKGVSWYKQKRRWVARINWNGGQHKYLGIFKLEEDAARAYNKAAQEKWGDDCYLNEVS